MTATERNSKRTTGQGALVTGAGTGIGAAITQRLAAQGMNLVMVARDPAHLESVAQRLRSEHGVDVLVVPLDLSDHEAPVRLAKQLEDAGVAVEILANNAGAALVGSVAEADPVRMRGFPAWSYSRARLRAEAREFGQPTKQPRSVDVWTFGVRPRRERHAPRGGNDHGVHPLPARRRWLWRAKPAVDIGWASSRDQRFPDRRPIAGEKLRPATLRRTRCEREVRTQRRLPARKRRSDR